jgi:hypothetical protein
MDTGVINRWAAALEHVESTDKGMNGRNLRRVLEHGADAPSMFDAIGELYFGPVNHLWPTAPSDPVLLEILDPVRELIMKFSRFGDVLGQLDDYIAAVAAARVALENERDSVRTVDQIIADMRLTLEVTLLVAATSHLGAMKVIEDEVQDRIQTVMKTGMVPPPSQLDIANGAVSKTPSETSINLRTFAALVAPKPVYEWHEVTNPNPADQPWIMKQFASQAIVSYFTEWEDHYRRELARAHGCTIYDIQINYFGDLSRMRQDYVHHRGFCANSQSVYCEVLKWFNRDDIMIPTAQNWAQLLKSFPAEDLRRTPVTVETGRDQIRGSASIPVLREFDDIAGTERRNRGDALDQALSEWTEKNRPRK